MIATCFWFFVFFLGDSPLSCMAFFLPLCKHAVLIPDVFNVIPELLQDTLQDQLLPTEWQLSLPILDAIFISQDAIFNL